jgi:hypothetical protein
MSDKQQRDEPKEKTPKGLEVPIPKRDEFLRNLRKVSKTGGLVTKGSPKQ